jgi:uncharacterized membrane protein
MPSLTWTVEAAVHATSAVAIYLGRVHRLNSWDVVRPSHLRPRPT